jgi:recombination protein RecA
MAASPASIRALLQSGALRWSSSVPSRAPGVFGLAELQGRLAELSGHGRLTAAVRLVHDAQRLGEPAVWLCAPGATFHPPDLAANGVDLAALPVVRAPELRALLRAADRVLRAGAFGLVVLDCDGLADADLPLPAQVRLAGLALQHDAALVCLVEHAGTVRGSLVSLRADCARRRTAPGEFECVLRVAKDKRRGRGWQTVEACHGAAGLR